MSKSSSVSGSMYKLLFRVMACRTERRFEASDSMLSLLFYPDIRQLRINKRIVFYDDIFESSWFTGLHLSKPCPAIQWSKRVASSSFLQGSRLLLHLFPSIESSNHRITTWSLRLTTPRLDEMVCGDDVMLDSDKALIKTHTIY